MCLGNQDRSAIDGCLQKLASLIVAFRTYGGKCIDINRGDFDIDFFRGLNNTCSDIHDKLLRLLDGGSQIEGKSAKVDAGEEIVVAKAVEVSAIEQ